MKTGAIYVRVSTEDQAQKFSIPSQKKDLIKLAEQKQYDIIKIYDEGGVSGESLTGRTQMLQLLKNIENGGHFDALFIVALDRLSRNMQDNLYLRQKLRDANIKIITPGQEYDLHNTENDLTLNIFGSISEYERKRIKERCDRGRREKKAQGGFLGGNPAIGYKLDHKSKKLVIDESQAEFVRDIFRLSAHPENSPYKLSQHYQTQRITITPRQIRRMTERHKILLYSGKTIDYDNNVVDAEWPAIITEELSGKLLSAKVKRSNNQTTRKATHLLTGLGIFKCRHCGRTVKTYSGRNGRPYYRCSSITYGESCVNNKMQQVELIDPLVFDAVVDILVKSDHVLAAYSTLSDNDEYKNNRNALERSITAEQEKINRLVDAIGEGILSKAEAANKLNPTRDRISLLKTELAALKPSNSFIDIQTFKSLIHSREFYNSATMDDKKELISILCEKISLTKTAIYIIFRVPFLTKDKTKILSSERRIRIR